MTPHLTPPEQKTPLEQTEQDHQIRRAIKRIADRVKSKHPGRKGGLTLIAEHFDIRPQAVQRWYDLARVPADRVLALVELGDGVAQPWEIRPSTFPAPSN